MAIGKLISYFAGLAILYFLFRLVWVSSFKAEQRTNEIGIRKVLGTSAANIVALLSQDFLKLVLLSNIIAWWARLN